MITQYQKNQNETEIASSNITDMESRLMKKQMTVIWKKDETYGKQKANWFSQRLESQEQNKITKYPSEYLDRKHKMSTIKGEDGRNNTGLRIIHRIIHTFYLGHILCVGKNGKDVFRTLKRGRGE